MFKRLTIIILALSILGACSGVSDSEVKTEARTPKTTVVEVSEEERAAVAQFKAVALFNRVVRLNEIEYIRWVSTSTTTTVPPTTTPPAPAPTPPPQAASEPGPGRRYVTSVIPDHLVNFFECLIDHESASAGVYLAVNASGKYRGAYQMDITYWNSHAPAEWKYMAGQHELAPPEVQDAAALDGFYKRGNAPWNGICGQYM